MINCTPDGRVSRSDAARFLGFSAKTLAEWHRKGIGPSSCRVGGRRFYWLSELREYARGEHSIGRSEVH